MRDGFPGGYDRLLHPLAQIEAACLFYEHAEAFVVDEWEGLYTDRAPTEEQLDNITPHNILDVLAKLGLRFELAGRTEEEGDFLNSFWSTNYSGSWIEQILYAHAHRVIDATEIDERVIKMSLQSTDLVFVPDVVGVASAAYFAMLDVDGESVAERAAAASSRAAKLLRSSKGLRPRARGEGPRSTGRVLADRIAVALKVAGRPLTPEEIAKRVKHDNVPSITAALHQMVEYSRPKRLKGWVARAGDGRYAWADEPKPDAKSSKRSESS